MPPVGWRCGGLTISGDRLAWVIASYGADLSRHACRTAYLRSVSPDTGAPRAPWPLSGIRLSFPLDRLPPAPQIRLPSRWLPCIILVI